MNKNGRIKCCKTANLNGHTFEKEIEEDSSLTSCPIEGTHLNDESGGEGGSLCRKEEKLINDGREEVKAALEALGESLKKPIQVKDAFSSGFQFHEIFPSTLDTTWGEDSEFHH